MAPIDRIAHTSQEQIIVAGSYVVVLKEGVRLPDKSDAISSRCRNTTTLRYERITINLFLLCCASFECFSDETHARKCLFNQTVVKVKYVARR